MDKNRFGNVLSYVALALIIALIYYLSSAIRQVESLEEKLAYAPPSLERANPSSLVEEGDHNVTYIPVYSHIYAGGAQPVPLQTTLSIRNSDSELPLTLHSVAYHNSEGKQVREHLESSVTLGPMATAEYLVDLRDLSGGSGANFLVRWSGSPKASKPIMEAIMIATGGAWLSFSSRGVQDCEVAL